MSGPSLSPTEIGKYAINLGYEVVASTYQPDELYFPKFTRVIPISAMIDAPYGHKSVGLVSNATPRKRVDGEEIQAGRMAESYPWQLATSEYADSLKIPDSLLEAAGAQRRVDSLIQSFITNFTKRAMILKDEFIAGMLQKGTLSAGSLDYFNDGYVGQSAISPKFIYDGKPWFAASGNAHPLKAATNAGSQGVNLTASLALSATNLDTVTTAMSVTNAIDEVGKRILIQPKWLVVPRQLRTTALQILQSEGSPADSTNAINPMRGMLEPLIHPFLTDDTSAWWVLTADAGVTVADSGAPVIEQYRDYETKSTVVQASFRFGAAVNDWRGAYCADKTAS